MACFTYLLLCADGTYYTGWTTDPEQRLATHNAGKGAKYTRGRRPVKLLHAWAFETKSEALKFERWLKAQPRAAKTRIWQEALLQSKALPTE